MKRIAGVALGVFVLALWCHAALADPQPSSMDKAPEGLPADGILVAQAEAAAEVSAPKVEAADEAKDEEGKDKKSKWWSIGFAYDFSHNFARERPVANNAFSIDPGFTTPYDINIGLHLGFGVSTLYPSGINGGNDIHQDTVDMDPISLSISRAFVIDKKYTGFTITPSLGQLFPYTSKYGGQVQDWRYAIKPAVALRVGKWGLSLSNTNGIQKNFHGSPYVWFRSPETGTLGGTPLNEWTYSNSTRLSYSVWKVDFGLGFGWSRSWRYRSDRQETPSNSLSYNASAGITPIENFRVGLSITTAGPERKYAGFKNDYTYPFRPEFTNFGLSLSYNL